LYVQSDLGGGTWDHVYRDRKVVGLCAFSCAASSEGR
jgi:hypothetical protein